MFICLSLVNGDVLWCIIIIIIIIIIIMYNKNYVKRVK